MKKIKICGVYTITNLINNKIYVGCSSDINKRIGDHKSFLRNNIHINKYLQDSYNKYGIENLKFEILSECDVEFMYSEENFWVNMLNTNNRKFGYNLGLTNPFGLRRHSEETKIKISNIQKGKRLGENNNFFGKKHSEESKLKMSIALKGRVIEQSSIDKREKTRQVNDEIRGFRYSDETKEKMSLAAKGIKKSKEHCDALIKASTTKKAIIMYDVEWNFIKEFESLSDARRELSCAVNLIYIALNNINRTAKGFKFKYKNDEK